MKSESEGMLVVTHRRWRPSDEEAFVDPEWLRSADDLNKEFVDHVRDYGGVVLGREVRGSVRVDLVRKNKEGRSPHE